jgi:hypothetical protein
LRLPFRHIGGWAASYPTGETDQAVSTNIRRAAPVRSYLQEEITADKLAGKKVAILAADGFEEVELTKTEEGAGGRRCEDQRGFNQVG